MFGVWDKHTHMFTHHVPFSQTKEGAQANLLDFISTGRSKRRFSVRKLPDFYGIWNVFSGSFVFGIKEKTPKEAAEALFKKIGKDAYKYRFEVRAYPEENP